MSHPYPDTYYPAMPTFEVRWGYLGQSLGREPLLAIVDTGADGTLVP